MTILFKLSRQQKGLKAQRSLSMAPWGVVAAILLVAGAPSIALAGITLDLLGDGITPAPGPFTNTSGNVVNELNVTFDNQIGVNQLLIELTSGQMILGNSCFEPGPGTVADDNATFVALGGRTNSEGANQTMLIPGAATSLNDACVAAGSCSADNVLTYNTQVLDVAWAPRPIVPQSGGPGYLVSQVVLTPSAEGTWSYLGSSGDGNNVLVHSDPINSDWIGGGIIENGQMTISLFGDYNSNGIVDAADFTLWRDNLGAPAGTLANDGDGGVIGQAQYETWKTNFGFSTTSAANPLHAPVPEPSAALLVLIATGPICLRMRVARVRF